LKAIVSNRLEVISSYLSKDREAELKRIKETEKQVDQLTSRLQELEMETVELRTKLRSEHDMALRDCLTGLPNRLAYEERIGQEVARWKRFKTPFCLLVWDVDHFKSVNDRFGHKAGDKALVTIAQELATSIRETDFVGRFGGEEFVMILSGSDKNAALKVANGIRGKVEDCGFNSQGRPVKITVSCGIAQFLDNDTHEHVFERADHALYQAKSDGRNRCVAL
jgi:diguanylate cyclase